MAILNVTEYTSVAKDKFSNRIPVGQEPANATQDVSVGAGSTQSNAFAATTRMVRVVADVDSRILFGSNPTATSTSILVVAGQAEYFGVEPGTKVAAIQN